MSWVGLSPHIRGIRIKDTILEGEGLSGVWFCTPSACKCCQLCKAHQRLTKTAALCLYYHLAKILAYECLLEIQCKVSPQAAQQDRLLESIHHHARAIASMSLSPDLADGALVVAVNSILYGTSPSP